MPDPVLGAPGPVLVTGGNGYVASWLVKRLLDDGFRVHATVRDPRDPAKTSHLEAIAQDSPGTLSLFRADLLDRGSFDQAMSDCDLVFHTASPLIVRGVDDPVRDLIEPATEGTRNVLEAANRTPSVRRVVLTSSIVAVYGDAADLRDLVAVNPGLVLGPGLSPHTKAEGVLVMRDFGSGYYRFGAPELEFAIVDVRDVADAHLRAGFMPEASGRHILVSETLSVIEIAGVLRRHFGDAFPLPRNTVSRSVALMLAPRRGIPLAVARRNLGFPLRFDNSRARAALGLAFRPAAKSVVEHFQQLLDDGLVAPAKPAK